MAPAGRPKSTMALASATRSPSGHAWSTGEMDCLIERFREVARETDAASLVAVFGLAD
jgi:hypothetical protein